MVYLSLILRSMKEDSNLEENLQERLYLLQNEASLVQKSFYIILEGWAQTGKGNILKSVTYRMDPKKYKVYSPVDTIYLDSHFPILYKYWQHFPAKGHAFFLLNSYYNGITQAYKKGKVNQIALERIQKSILNLEKTLSDDGVVFVKFFLDLEKKELQKRLKSALKEGKTWEVTKADKDQAKNYKNYESLFRSYRDLTDQPYSPWITIPAKENDSAKIHVLTKLIQEMERVLKVSSDDLLEKLKKAEATE